MQTKIIIKGQTPAQKNKKKISCVGSVPRIYTQKDVKDWQEDAHLQLKRQVRGQAESRVSVFYMFYVKDNRRRDLDNMVASINDAIVKAGLVKDDSWQCLKSDGADAEIDRENPRAEITITETGQAI